MESVDLFTGFLTEQPIELGPDAFCFDGSHCFTVWLHAKQRAILKEFCGETVCISIRKITRDVEKLDEKSK